MPWKNNRAKPVIGILGGIGSGKSTVSRLLAARGCAVIDSDQLSHQALEMPAIKTALVQWLGESILKPNRSIDRKAVARQVFGDPAQTARLNALIHPEVARQRGALMADFLQSPAIQAIVWDSPLLVEAGLVPACDALIFVHAQDEIRYARVRENRGWTAEELIKRENLQIPLDKKAELSDYCVDNSGDEAATLSQIEQVLSQLFASHV